MAELIPGVRNAVRALIVRDDRVLVQHKVYEDDSERFTLPGGAPDLGETLVQGLQRECREEIGTEVTVLDLVHVADYFKARDTRPPTRRQQVEFVFRCEVPARYAPASGPHPDKHQRDVLWLPVAELELAPFSPRGLSALIDVHGAGHPAPGPVYLGLID